LNPDTIQSNRHDESVLFVSGKFILIFDGRNYKPVDILMSPELPTKMIKEPKIKLEDQYQNLATVFKILITKVH
jgi:hypothetical protein